MVKQSPTLSAPPFKQAIVLFDGKSTGHWVNFHWKLLGGGDTGEGGILKLQYDKNPVQFHHVWVRPRSR